MAKRAQNESGIRKFTLLNNFKFFDNPYALCLYFKKR